MGRVVAVGSLNSTKINAVAKAYSMFGITVDVRPVKVQTPTQQPLGRCHRGVR
jgi:non-canonical (house-cleaning) NTP pyrophosphatase